MADKPKNKPAKPEKPKPKKEKPQTPYPQQTLTKLFKDMSDEKTRKLTNKTKPKPIETMTPKLDLEKTPTETKNDRTETSKIDLYEE